MRARHVIAGAGLYLAVAGSTYSWVKSKQAVAKDAARAGADDADASAALLGARGPAAAADATARRFDSLSRCYDETVGSEERWMLYGLLRSRLLRGVRGKVLEIGCGTGRNLPHLPLADVDELFLVDRSAEMVRAAEEKFYGEELKLGYRHPHLRARFCLGDAEDLVAGPGEAPRAPPLPPPNRDKAAAAAAPEAAAAAASSGFSRLWRAPSRSSSSSGAAAPGGGARRREEQSPQKEEGAAAAGAAAPPATRRPPDSSSSAPPPASRLDGDDQPQTPCPSNPSTTSRHHHQQPQEAATMMAKFAPGTFDVVVDTFGLCSVEDPVRALRQAALLAKPRTGRVLLLEHGRPPPGTLGAWLLSDRMDAAAAEHKRRWGCWFNRDVDAIVRESGLRVVSRGSWHFGTTYVYELAPAVAEGEERRQGGDREGGGARGGGGA